MDRREMYTTQQADGTYVTTTTRTQAKYREEEVIGCGPGQLDSHYCMGPHGILRIIEMFLCLVVICLIVSVYGPGPFKGILFGQTILLLVAGVAMCLSFCFLLVYFLRLHETHLDFDFWSWPLSDRVFSATAAILFLILAIVEAYYSTGAWANNCNDVGGDGIIHNGCHLIWEWAFASFISFVLAIIYAVSAVFAYRHRRSLRPDTDYA